MDERQMTRAASDSGSPNGFQVVRREFFSHTREPMLTFSRYRIYVNAVCLAKFEDVTGVQVLIDREARVLALRPSEEGARDVWPWCGVSGGKRRPRQTACRLFFAKVADMMGWSLDCRYKVLGRLVRAGGGVLLVFDLAAAEAFPQGGDPSAPVFPETWRDSFGLPDQEHRRALGVRTFDGHAVFTVAENAPEGGAFHG